MTAESKRPPLCDVRELILAYFKKWAHRPVLTGQISLELRSFLDDAQRWLDELEAEEVIRQLTPEELKKYGLVHGYMLVKR